MLVRDVRTYLLAEEPRWDVIESSPAGEPRVRELTPLGKRSDVRHSLLLPPPARVRFAIAPEEVGLVLCGASAFGGAGLAEDAARELSVVMEVRRNGDVVHRHRTSLAGADAGWREFGEPRGIAVEPGDVIELATYCEDAAERVVDPGVGVLAGFGRLRLEHQEHVARARSSPERPNLVLVVQDTLRRDRLAVYGYERSTSPNLDRLAAEGTVFDAAYSTSSWTWPSTTSILTGMLPERHGLRNERSCFVDADLDLLPEALQRAGFTTAAFSANGLIGPSKNFDQGFERFASDGRGFGRSSELVPETCAWLAENAGRRMFLYLHLADTHGFDQALPEARARFAPDVPAEFGEEEFLRYSRNLRHARGKTGQGAALEEILRPSTRDAVSDLYDAVVFSGDVWLGKVLFALEELGLDDETVVAFTSDHGEELYDHGLLRHGHSLFGELVRVPLVIAGPGVARGRRIGTPVSNRHLASTLARLGGVELDGLEDPLDLLRGNLSEEPIFFSTDHGLWEGSRQHTTIRGVRADGFVLHAHAEHGVRLYDLESDPEEQRDIAALHGERVESLRALLAEHEARDEPTARGDRGAGEQTLQLLEDIGYMGD